MYDYTTTSASAGSDPVASLISLALSVFAIVCMWRIFTRMGLAGWKCIIPIYGTYVLSRAVTGKKGITYGLIATGIVAVVLGFMALPALIVATYGGVDGTTVGLLGFLFIAACIASFVLSIIMYNGMSRCFGHGTGFTVGLVLLNIVFIGILAFSDNVYMAPASEWDEA